MYLMFWSSGQDSVVKKNEQPSKFSMSTYMQSRQNVKTKNFDIDIGNKASIFLCRNVKYHRRLSCGHDTVIINIGQPFNSSRPSDAYMCQWTRIIGSDNGLSPDRRQAIIWSNDGILLIQPLGTNFSEILLGIQTSSFNKIPTEFLVNYCTIISWNCHNKPRLCCYRAEIGKTVPITALSVPERLQNWAFRADLDTVNLKGCSLFSGTELWPLH